MVCASVVAVAVAVVVYAAVAAVVVVDVYGAADVAGKLRLLVIHKVVPVLFSSVVAVVDTIVAIIVMMVAVAVVMVVDGRARAVPSVASIIC